MQLESKNDIKNLAVFIKNTINGDPVGYVSDCLERHKTEDYHQKLTEFQLELGQILIKEIASTHENYLPKSAIGHNGKKVHSIDDEHFMVELLDLMY